MVVTSFGSAASPAGSGQPPVLGEVFRDCGMPEMVVVPPGSFVMGSPETEPGRDPEEVLREPLPSMHLLPSGVMR